MENLRLSPGNQILVTTKRCTDAHRQTGGDDGTWEGADPHAKAEHEAIPASTAACSGESPMSFRQLKKSFMSLNHHRARSWRT
jgi:hypothetical protein